jgi:radical SAM protein with 4Fe4S-binding SPASM domain
MDFKAPLYIAWEVTRLCNARCVHCYSDSGPGVRDEAELPTDAALRIIDDLADAGLLILAFSGGEPLMRRDIFQLIERARARGLVVNIASNGALITPALAVRLRESGVHTITISLDGADAATHDGIRQLPGLFEKACRAIRILVDHELRVVVSFTPMVTNHQQGPAVVALAHSLGAQAANMSEYVPAGRGTLELALPPETLRSVVERWIEMRHEYDGRLKIIWHDCRVSLLVPPEERDLYSGCGAGKTTARVMVDGTVTPCVFLPNAVGNLASQRFAQIWTTSQLLQKIRARTLTDGNCADCQYKPVCGGCRAVSMAVHGDPLRGDAACWLVADPGAPTLGLIPAKDLLRTPVLS